MTTPTGAAILTTLADRFGPLPRMTIDRIGYGAGNRDLAGSPNLLRLVVGEVQAETTPTHEHDHHHGHEHHHHPHA